MAEATAGQIIEPGARARLEALKEALDELKKEMSELRRQGRDTLMADLELRIIASKLMYAEITEDPIDIEAIKNLLVRAKEELNASPEF